MPSILSSSKSASRLSLLVILTVRIFFCNESYDSLIDCSEKGQCLYIKFKYVYYKATYLSVSVMMILDNESYTCIFVDTLFPIYMFQDRDYELPV